MKLITKDAIQDVIDGAKNYEFWMTFGMNDIKAKYRRSKLGQWWITLSVAIFIFVIGGLYRGIFNADSGTYLAYMASGYILWLFISEAISTGNMVLATAKPYLLQKCWPISIFVFRLLYRELIVMLHHAVLLPPIFIWLGIWPSIGALFISFIGVLLVFYTSFWVVLILAIITLRYRDMPPIIASLMRMAFFATPVIWVQKNLGGFGEMVLMFNPFAYFISIVRDPLLQNHFDITNWVVSGLLAVFVTIVGLITLSQTKHNLTYWL